MKVIYAIVNLKNGKKYIGSATNFSSRKSRHLSMLNKGIHHSRSLQHSWNKNSPENYKFIILEKLTAEDDKIIREQYYMDYYKSYNKKFGYNMSNTARGASGIQDKKVYQFNLDGSFVKSFDNCVIAGSEFGCDGSSISECARGGYRFSHGYIWSYEDNISEDRIKKANSPFKFSNESKLKMSASAIARTDQRKPIEKYSLDGVFLEEFDSAMSAVKKYGYSSGSLSDALHGKNRQAYGFLWKFKNKNDE